MDQRCEFNPFMVARHLSINKGWSQGGGWGPFPLPIAYGVLETEHMMKVMVTGFTLLVPAGGQGEVGR